MLLGSCILHCSAYWKRVEDIEDQSTNAHFNYLRSGECLMRQQFAQCGFPLGYRSKS
jgi:hypothetical protein